MSLEDTKSSIFNPRVRREADNGRFQLSPKDYLERYHILKYLQDAIGLMVENKAERPLHFLADYFASIERGVNVLYRSFRYINSTPRNRQSFIQQYYEVYKNISPNEELTVDSFHQLLSLLCRDFPYSLVRNASRITMDVKEVPTKGKFREFSLKIFILFFFSEFMNQSALAFRTIDQHATGKVKVSAFMEHLKGILGKNPNFSHPELNVLKLILGNGDNQNEVMFNEFCVKLFAHPYMERALRFTPPYKVLKAGLGRLFREMSVAASTQHQAP
eukprot:CAMPEP_0197525068 /NCGR_PEP_ID=MMETSP1318-20131121/10600_1 /TAXON_ID=552666 /ORGANISM="Partenskyella glossopodia, Strain RCC365" /LENGTH=273 /DNA_ID=CAMNT_0043078229 /DNA_START=286 /DNA_END=1107 /DNA_ORIENTATION=+